MTRVLLITADSDIETMVRAQLEEIPELTLACFTEVREALTELSSTHYDIIISPYGTFDFESSSLLEELRHNHQNTPVIFMVKEGQKEVSSDTLYDARGFILESEIRSTPAKLIHIIRCLLRCEGQTQHLCSELNRYLSIYNSLDDGIYIVDPETYTILSANAAAIKILGINPIGKKCYEVLLGGSTEPCVHCDNAALSRGILEPGALPWEFKRASDDRWYRCVSKDITWSNGKFVKMEIIVDITDSRRVDRQINLLHVFREKMRSLTDLAVIEFDKKGKISYTNQAAAKLLGFSRKEIEEHFVWKYLDEQGKVAWFRLMDEISPRDSESIECTVNGKDRIIEAYLNVVFNRDIKDKLIDGVLFIIEKARKEFVRFY